MCGIVSVISRRQDGFYGEDLELFEQLLVLDTLRGLDSTGVFSVDSQGNVNSVKIASHPYHLFACDEWKAWRGRAVSIGRILVGHNRKATKGTINSQNAHPFHENNIMLVHNGSLREDHKKSYADVEVDSHALAVAFSQKPAEEVIPEIDGAFALVWWDIEKERLFAIRNEERPLNIVLTDDLLIICSEPWMAHVLLGRKNKKVLSTFEIGEGQLYEFKLDGKYSITKELTLKDPWVHYTNGRYTQHGGACSSSVQGPKSSGTQGQSGNSNARGSGTTALTVVKGGTASTSLQLDGKDGIPDANNGHVACDDYPRDKEILVKFYEAKPMPSGKYNVLRGKSTEPGGEEVDVLAYAKSELFSMSEMNSILSGPSLATVQKHTASTCGRSLIVNQIRLPETVEIHNGRITKHEWDYITTNCKCKKCDARIYEEEQFFTGVSRKTGNKLAVTCPDCIEDQLIGEYKHEFNQNRLASLQAHIAKREELATVAGSGSQPANSPTLH